MHRALIAEHVAQGILGRGLADAAGDGDDAGRERSRAAEPRRSSAFNTSSTTTIGRPIAPSAGSFFSATTSIEAPAAAA